MRGYVGRVQGTAFQVRGIESEHACWLESGGAVVIQVVGIGANCLGGQIYTAQRKYNTQLDASNSLVFLNLQRYGTDFSYSL